MFIHPVHKPAGGAQWPTYPFQVPPALPPAINQQQGWRGQTEEPTQLCPVIASVYHQPEDFYYCGGDDWSGELPGLAKQAHLRAVLKCEPHCTVKQTGGERRIEEEDLVIWRRNNGAEMACNDKAR